MSNSAPISHLLYLHGFRSSPQSAKAQLMHAAVEKRAGLHWWCPQLPPSPQAAMQMVQQGIQDWPRETMAVVGSSLGGFYATWVAETFGCEAVVLNPAVDPARDLAKYIGEQTNWHDPKERFFFQPEFVGALKALAKGPLQQPENYLAVITKGDEVLDWREMHARYAACSMRLLEGGDHAISDFPAHLPAVLEFLGLN
jgi:predicted esterase YcpF (UPF0227 family)